MAKLTDEEVKHVAKLAKLELNEKEVNKLGDQLSETLETIDKLNEIDTSEVTPTSQVTGLINITRNDEVTPSLSQDVAISQSKSTHNNYFKVDAILNNK